MKERILVLDGLRGLAILLVMVHHTCEVLQWPGPHMAQIAKQFAYCGVDLFFVLSGFLLFSPYAHSVLHGAPWPSWQQFYLRRARRILPAYYVTTAIIVAFLFAAGVPAVVFTSGGLGLPILLHDMWRDTYVTATDINVVLWTLTIEWQFYLVLPWLGLLLRRSAKGKQTRLLIGLGGVIAWGMGIRTVALIGHYHWRWTDPILPLIYGQNGKCLELFALGMAVAVLPKPSWRAIQIIAGAATLGLITCIFWAQGSHANAWSPNWTWRYLGDFVVCICFAGILGILLVGLSGYGPFFVLKPLRWLGQISYSVYLIHYPTVLAASEHGPVAVILSWGGVLLVSAILYRYVEAPFLKTKLGHHLPATQTVPQRADAL